MCSIDSYLTVSERKSIRAPITDAKTLPHRAFTSSAFFELETEFIFKRKWLAIGFGHTVPNTGDVAPITVLGMPLLVVRGDDGIIRVFYNICPFDACPVVLEPARGLDELYAPYHGWRYNLFGKLVAIPYWDGKQNTELSALGKHDGDLIPVKTECWHDVIFIDLSNQAGELPEHTAGLDDLLSDYDFTAIAPARNENGESDTVTVSLNSNWKTYFENDCMNGLHASTVHDIYRYRPEVPRVTPDGNKKSMDIIKGNCLGFRYDWEDMKEVYPRWPLPPISVRPDVMPEHGFFVGIYPNLTVAAMPHTVSILFFLPEACDHTIITSTTYVHASAAQDSKYKMVRKSIDNFFSQAAREDARIVEAIQHARSSPVCEQQFFSPFWNAPYYRFTNMILDDLELSLDDV